MTHPILLLQASLVEALRGDAQLADLAPVFDVPPAGVAPPYLVIARHDVLGRDGDVATGWEHRVLLQAWAADASRKAVLVIVGRVVELVFAAELDSAGLRVTHRRHDRTDTAIDAETGRARAAVAMTFYTEPA
jgi:hypothetical protein